MVSPHDPEEKGNGGEATQDNTSPADSKKQANKGGHGESAKKEDEDE